MADSRGSGSRSGGKGGSSRPSGGSSSGRGGSSGRPGSGGRSSGPSRGGDNRGRNGGDPSRRTSSRKSDRAEWGSLTRKGASYIEGRQEPSGFVEPEPEEYVIDKRIRDEAKEAIDRGNKRAPRKPRRNERSKLPKVPLELDDTGAAMNKAMGKEKGPKALEKLSRAALEFADDRLADARRTIKPIVEDAPNVAEVRELNGLILYRLGKWKDAAKELEVFRELSGTTEQHPVLADCYRALQKWEDVDDLWEELKAASPSADLMTEGRIVAAGAMADRGDLKGAIGLLEQGWKQPKRAKDHHLSRAYALADLYERAGRTPRARDLFGWIQRQPGAFADTAARLSALS